jgi:elongation factor G
MAFHKALHEARPVLLEPVMRVEVIVPEENTGDVIGDLSARRGEIEGMAPLPGGMQAFMGTCRSQRCLGTPPTCGRRPRGAAPLPWSFDYYAPVPQEVSARIPGEPY